MQTTNIAIACALVLVTAACTRVPDPKDDAGDSTSNMSGTEAMDPHEADDESSRAGGSDRDPSSDGKSKYGWQISITELGIKGYTLEEIVTGDDAVVRADKNACVACHTWARYQTRRSFCARVDDFLKMPTSTGAATDPANAKPASLKRVLKSWKSAGCPN